MVDSWEEAEYSFIQVYWFPFLFLVAEWSSLMKIRVKSFNTLPIDMHGNRLIFFAETFNTSFFFMYTTYFRCVAIKLLTFKNKDHLNAYTSREGMFKPLKFETLIITWPWLHFSYLFLRRKFTEIQIDVNSNN